MPYSKVYISFPRAGLGNKLLTWSRAFVFAEINGLEIHNSSWFSISLGVWIRRENKKRIYLGYFKNANLYKHARFFFYRLLYNKVKEPSIENIGLKKRNSLFVFKEIFRQPDFFKEVRRHRELVLTGLYSLLTPNIKSAYNRFEKPVIGVHIRRGDFKIGSKVTPLSFFIEVIETIRKHAEQDLPVTVFTDGDYSEIEPLLELNQVKMAEEKADILDLLLLASSKIVVLSIGSTFSYWGAFLSEGVIIKHPEEWHVPFRLKNNPNYNKEIIWDKYNLDLDILEV